MPGPWEIAAIVLIVLLLFGGKKLPELARGLGKGMREFKNEFHGIKDELMRDDDEQAADKTKAQPKADAGEKPAEGQPASPDKADSQKTA
jgi:sec-independent protein translocase protein TatA